MSRHDELLAALFENQGHLLKVPLSEWLSESRRFFAFVQSNASKVRKKLRSANDPGTAGDLLLELETAYLLLRQETLSARYEPEHRQNGRSADFSVSYTTSQIFTVEVTRIRRVAATTTSSISERMATAIGEKLGQLSKSQANVIVIGIDGWKVEQSELDEALKLLRMRGERMEHSAVQRYGFRDRGEFFEHTKRLSMAIARSVPMVNVAQIGVWENPEARHPLFARVRTALKRSHEQL